LAVRRSTAINEYVKKVNRIMTGASMGTSGLIWQVRDHGFPTESLDQAEFVLPGDPVLNERLAYSLEPEPRIMRMDKPEHRSLNAICGVSSCYEAADTFVPQVLQKSIGRAGNSIIAQSFRLEREISLRSNRTPFDLDIESWTMLAKFRVGADGAFIMN